jgi:hypothetical protein
MLLLQYRSMSDPLRTDRLPTAGEVPEADRDARVEELLLAGLDHYFLGQHELAISVWTRVLFLDRGHARARAYIERARSAIAERQRESEELLHTGVAAFDRGDAGAARRLLTSALERGAASEEAVALLERLDRLEMAARSDRSRAAIGPLALPPDHPSAPAEASRPSRIAWIAAGVCAGLGVAALAAWLWTGPGAGWVPAPSAATPPASPSAVDPLPIPSPAEVAFSRAQRLHEAGRLHDALDALDGIRQGDPWRPRADALRATIQRQLLDTVRVNRGASTATQGQPVRQ